MRYTPVAAALCLVVAVSSSISHSQATQATDPRANALIAEGNRDVARGDLDSAIGAFEAALTVEPGSAVVLVALADAERDRGLTGKALHYYRVALEADPRNIGAIAGEGVALAEKGAVDKAGRNLARLEGLCGKQCPQATEVAGAIAKGPSPRVKSAKADVAGKPEVTEN